MSPRQPRRGPKCNCDRADIVATIPGGGQLWCPAHRRYHTGDGQDPLAREWDEAEQNGSMDRGEGMP